MLVRQTLHPTTRLTESHPKAALWLLRLAVPGNPVASVDLAQLQSFFSGLVQDASDHERDAALGALSAFAMTTGLEGWRDLFPLEINPFTPIAEPLGYWLPQ
jgi:hypothetical protein